MINPRDTRPPGPRHLPLVGSLIDYARAPLAFLERCAWGGYGDVAYLSFLGQPTYVLNLPEHIEHVLVTKQRNYVKDKLQRGLLQEFVGQGLLASEGALWLRQRRLMQPAFHRQRIAAYGQVMGEHSRRLLATWKPGEQRDIAEDMMGLTLGIVVRCLFGLEMEDGAAAEVGPALAKVIDHFARMQTLVVPGWVPTPENLSYRAALRRLYGTVDGIVRRRREAGGDTGDLLSMLLQVQDEDGSRMSDRQVRDEALTLMLAGHETTAIGLTFCWDLLARNPEAEAALHQELDSVLGGREPTVEDLPALPFTEYVVKEALRLYPPAWSLSREAVEDDELGGWHIPAGAMVWVNQWTVHRDPRFYEEPLAFRPERWANGLERRLHRFAWFPFGGGLRLCIGLSFAMMEARLALATLAQRFRLERLSKGEVELLPSITLRPKHGLPMRLHAR
ncbi:cytochrome P450 [Hyalangium rubrum]|uniref:Cytochrome P450 n=1 Tax=Hyalangium rubrum TaxID=3103134 RepID=A0ABU5H1M5_9BACT|nr:cytochrome P450 [Hyalangium sp. s54d21]MDY7226814.1 cytochrome P450 [Hyalangium sp. s54d21]